MKKTLLLLTLSCCMVFAANAQISPLNNAQPTAGVIVYMLPRTAIKLRVDVMKESQVEGPYARFAQKYLSVDLSKRVAESYTIERIIMMPFQEADPSQTYLLNMGALKNARANFLAFSNEGLVLPAGYQDGAMGQATFSTIPANVKTFFDLGAEPNFVNESATYYNNVKTDTGYVRVPVQRSQLVEKNIEKKAEDAANAIFNLRKKRIELITGESDNIPTDLGAALEEMRKIEEEYLSLFVGKSYRSTETYYFTVVPDATQSKHSYIAFRFSETQGVVPSSNVAGRPIMLELALEKGGSIKDVSRDDSGKTPYIYYRIPQTVQVRLLNGQTVLLQDRLPVSQLGSLLSIPADAAMR